MQNTVNYLFGAPVYGVFDVWDKVYLGVALALILTGLVLIMYRKVKRTNKVPFVHELITRFVHLTLTIGVSGLIWGGLKNQLIRVLGTHFIIFLIYIIGLIWLYYILKYWKGDYKKKKQEFIKLQERNKYL